MNKLIEHKQLWSLKNELTDQDHAALTKWFNQSRNPKKKKPFIIEYEDIQDLTRRIREHVVKANKRKELAERKFIFTDGIHLDMLPYENRKWYQFKELDLKSSKTSLFLPSGIQGDYLMIIISDNKFDITYSDYFKGFKTQYDVFSKVRDARLFVLGPLRDAQNVASYICNYLHKYCISELLPLPEVYSTFFCINTADMIIESFNKTFIDIQHHWKQMYKNDLIIPQHYLPKSKVI